MNKRAPAITVLLFFIFLKPFYSATCTAIASSNWTNTAAWSCGHAPTCNDVIIIPSGYTITITTNVSLTGGGCSSTSITVNGVLFMSGNASQLNLVATATINIPSGGKIITDVTNNSQKIFIGTGPAEWDSSDGNVNGPWVIVNGTSVTTLPIDLLTLTATCIDEGVRVDWTTLTESNNDYFIVEKSQDAKVWTRLAELKGAGNSSALQYYTCIDPVPGYDHITYYRLSQVDFDGTSKKYTAIDALCNKVVSENDITLFPNPANDKIHITFSGDVKNLPVHIICVNTWGGIVFEEFADLSRVNTFVLPAYMPDGIYSIVISSPELNIPARRLVVRR